MRVRTLLASARALAAQNDIVTLRSLAAHFASDDFQREALNVAVKMHERDTLKYVNATFVCSSCNRVAFVSRETYDEYLRETLLDDALFASVEQNAMQVGETREITITESDANDSLDYCTLCACSLDDDDIVKRRALSHDERATRAKYLDERIS